MGAFVVCAFVRLFQKFCGGGRTEAPIKTVESQFVIVILILMARCLDDVDRRGGALL